MRREALALAVAGLVILSITAGYIAGAFTSRSTITVLTTAMPITLPNSVCTTPVPRINETGFTEAYQVAPYSIGVVCVTYEFQGNGSYSFSPTDYGPQVGSNGTSWAACGFETGSTIALACSVISITPYQPSINHLTSQNITVAYTVRTEANVGELYWFFIGDCEAIPLAIGFTPAWASPPGFGCNTIPGAPTNVAVTGTWNINVTEVSTIRPPP